MSHSFTSRRTAATADNEQSVCRIMINTDDHTCQNHKLTDIHVGKTYCHAFGLVVEHSDGYGGFLSPDQRIGQVHGDEEWLEGY